MSAETVVTIRGLEVRLSGAETQIVSGVDLTLHAGEIVALVGESGSGKTTVGSALLGYTRHGAAITGGEIVVAGHDVLGLDAAALRELRGRVVSYVPQDPATALNPTRRIGVQLAEAVTVHEIKLSRREIQSRLESVLGEVRLPADAEFLKRFPHQLSGGQQQRLVLAMAFVLRPRAIVLDEPTTGLDVSTQAHVLRTVRELCKRHAVAALYVTHDLAVVEGLADRVVVLYAGQVIESGPVHRMFTSPRHPYTRGLLASIPDLSARRVLRPIGGYAPPPGSRDGGCLFAARCEHRAATCADDQPTLLDIGDDEQVRCTQLATVPTGPIVLVGAASTEPPEHVGAVPDVQAEGICCGYGGVQVVHDVSFSVRRGECLAVVGESGSGKSTLSRSLVGLVEPTGGRFLVGGEVVAGRARSRPADVRRRAQYVFQNPYRSMNPRMTVRQSLSVPLAHFFGIRGSEATKQIAEVLEQVALPARSADVRPRDLSGGERQRAAIARALLCRPQVLVCDEVTSALDVSVQAAIIGLLDRLRRDDDLTLIFVTHNLAVVRAIADRVLVLRDGRVVETGPVDELFDRPQVQYTQSLLADTPRLTVV